MMCSFCKKEPETMRHLFCECPVVVIAKNRIIQAPQAGRSHMILLDSSINATLFQSKVTKAAAIRLLRFSLAVWRARRQLQEWETLMEFTTCLETNRMRWTMFAR